jgi:hypothetical protein
MSIVSDLDLRASAPRTHDLAPDGPPRPAGGEGTHDIDKLAIIWRGSPNVIRTTVQRRTYN